MINFDYVDKASDKSENIIKQEEKIMDAKVF